MRFKNEVIVGIVLLLGLVVAVVGTYWLTGRQWGAEEREIAASFREVGLLAPGSPVKYRGVTIGRVETIELSDRGDGVFVEMSVTPDIVLPEEPAVLLSTESFFGDWQAAIVSEDNYPEIEFTRAPRPGVLPGASLPDITELTAVAARIAEDLETLSERVELAFTEETAIKIRETVENVQEVSEQLTGFVDQQTDVFAAAGQNVLSATQNIEDATASAEQAASQVSTAFSDGGEVQQILANARQASENLQELSIQLQSATQGVPALVARADTTLEAIGQTAESVNQVVAGLEPTLAEIGPTVAEARQAIATLNRAATRIEQGEGTLGRLVEDPALYEETQRAIVTLRRLLADLQANPGKYVGEVF